MLLKAERHIIYIDLKFAYIVLFLPIVTAHYYTLMHSFLSTVFLLGEKDGQDLQKIADIDAEILHI